MWLITGAAGQLGRRLCAALGDEGTGLSRGELDITDAAAVRAAVRRLRPEVVINTAAYTAVDAAETDEDAARLINATAVEHLARASAAAGARFVHVSTDYVFDGRADAPYEVDAPTAPRTAYGRTKLLGEQAALEHGGSVVRTAWVYGGPSANFVDTMRRLADERDTVEVVSDQVGCPTYARDLAAALVELGRSSLPAAVWHYVNAGQASWYELARETFRLTGHDPDRVHPVSSAQFVRPAPRPAWSVLSTSAWTAAGLPAPRDWRRALRDYLGG